MRPKGVDIGGTISGYFRRSYSGHNSNIVVLKVGNLYVSHISTRVNLVDPFMACFRSPIEVNRVIVIILDRVVDSFQGVHLLSILVVVVILG